MIALSAAEEATVVAFVMNIKFSIADMEVRLAADMRVVSPEILPEVAPVVIFRNPPIAAYDPVVILALASLGNCLGGSTNYFLGFYGRKALSKKKELKSEQLVKRFGFWAALFSWLPLIGDPLLVALGIYRVSLWRTLVLMAIGKIFRYVIVFWAWLAFT